MQTSRLVQAPGMDMYKNNTLLQYFGWAGLSGAFWRWQNAHVLELKCLGVVH